MNLRYIEELKYDLLLKADSIVNDVDVLRLKVNDLSKAVYEYNSDALKQNPYIVKRIVKHIAEGYTVDNAVNLAADELQISTERAEAVFSNQKKHLSKIRLYARKYTAEKLKNAGYSAEKIAGILHISKSGVFKLLKSDCLLY